jgi:hypothetical protein
MMTRQEAIDELGKLINDLEHFRIRPTMYLGSLRSDLAVAWLNGFRGSERFISKEISDDRWHDIRKQAVESRGLTWSARHPSDELRERGFSEREIIDELLLIEIAVLKAAQSFLD